MVLTLNLSFKLVELNFKTILIQVNILIDNIAFTAVDLTHALRLMVSFAVCVSMGNG